MKTIEKIKVRIVFADKAEDLGYVVIETRPKGPWAGYIGEIVEIDPCCSEAYNYLLGKWVNTEHCPVGLPFSYAVSKGKQTYSQPTKFMVESIEEVGEITPTPQEPQCPECLNPASQHELDMFGGLCEECAPEE